MSTKAHEKKAFMPEVITKPQGYVLLKLEKESIRIELDFNAMADADEHLGRAAIQGFVEDPMNLNTLRVLFFFGIREHRDDVTDLRAAGRLLSGVTLEVISGAIVTAMEVSGMMKPEEREEINEASLAIVNGAGGETSGKK